MILPQGMSWKAILIPSEAFYVVYPSPRGGYNAQAILKAIDAQECKNLSQKNGEAKETS